MGKMKKMEKENLVMPYLASLRELFVLVLTLEGALN
jgi:hypothetical protein